MIAKSTINFTGYIRAGIILCLIFSLSITNIKSQTTQGTKMAVYQPPTSPRATYNFNSGWKFAFGDTTGANKMEFNDKTWANVSLPHTWNEIDSYRAYISHGVRLPKSLFYVSRVMQNEQPDLHIIGHWNYPADTKKTMYVAATHCDKVEIFLNGKSLGVETKPTVFVDTFNQRPQGSESGESEGTGYVYAFPDIKFAPGTLKAFATKGGKVVAQQEIQTAGETKAIKLTLHTGPKGLQADGSDVALIDF